MDQKKIGIFIAESRKAKGLTQEVLGEKLGVSKNAVSKWERGLNLPDVSLMPELCSILDISLNELFAGEHISENHFKSQSEKNILDIFNLEKRRNRKYKMALICIVIMFCTFVCIAVQPLLVKAGYLPDDDLACCRLYVVGADGIQGEVDVDKFIEKHIDFDIGANKYGKAVFKDPAKALKRLKKDYSQGIALVQKEFVLPPLCIFTYRLYMTYGWQTSGGTAEEQEQAAFVSQFFDIYENSFN